MAMLGREHAEAVGIMGWPVALRWSQGTNEAAKAMSQQVFAPSNFLIVLFFSSLFSFVRCSLHCSRSFTQRCFLFH
jgi:hypothetical protein